MIFRRAYLFYEHMFKLKLPNVNYIRRRIA